MLLIAKRHEILADIGLGVPYAGKVFYDLSTWRDNHSELLGRITAEFAYLGTAFISFIEAAVRIPLTLISLAFSKDRSAWFKGLNLSILTGIYCLYALLINLFVQNVSSHLIQFDLKLRAPLKDHFLLEACAAGHYDLANYLLKQSGINPHHIFEIDVSSSLVSRLMGHTKLDALFELNDYEKDYLDLKLLSLWLGLEGEVELHGHKLKLEGMPSRWLFNPLSSLIDEFAKEFKYLELGEENAALLQEALWAAYTDHSYESIAKTVRDKKLCFLGSGWKRHGICLAFYGDYMAIGNPGERDPCHSSLEVSKIDPSLLTAEIVEEIQMHETLDAETAKEYFYRKLPAKLSKSGKVEKDGLCEAFAAIAPKSSEGGICARASKTAAIRFAWGMLLEDPKRARFETKLFTDWAATKGLNALSKDKFTALKPREAVIAQASEKATPKQNRLWRNRWRAWLTS